MRATLRDPALMSYARRFVWLSLNYENPKNQAFLVQRADGFPTSYVIDPGGAMIAMQSGSASVEQFEKFLDQALAKPVMTSAADAALRKGNELLAEHQMAAAAKTYREALTLGGKTWPNRDHALEQWIGALTSIDASACATTADAEAPAMPRQNSFVEVVLMGLSCANNAAGTDAAVAARLEAFAREAVTSPSASEDDRYQLYDAMIVARTRAKDVPGRHQLGHQYLEYVEQLPAPKNNDERAARDQSRLRSALAMDSAERVIPTLEASERAMADNYTASSRLASAYAAVQRFDEAIAASTRGLARGAGPIGSARLLALRARGEAAKKDLDAARTDLNAALESAKQIPVASARQQSEAALRSQLAALGK